MDMYDIEKKMEDEINEERANFAKDLLKRKRLELDKLDEEIGKLADRLEKAEEEYDEILGMSIDDVYDNYKFPTGGVIGWDMSYFPYNGVPVFSNDIVSGSFSIAGND